MGYIKHNAVIVTHWNKKHVEAANIKAREIFTSFYANDANSGNGEGLISEILKGVINEQYSFFIAPDGSKEGWSASDIGDEARKQFQSWLLSSEYYCDYIEVRFGGDDADDYIVRSKDLDLENAED